MTELERILDGIDRDEGHPDGGWWETSYGAKFGAQKLAEVRALFERQEREHIEQAARDFVGQIVAPRIGW